MTDRTDGIRILSLNAAPALLGEAAEWFHARWGIEESAYRESMEESLEASAPPPRWFLALSGGEIAGGCGVIENDFHPRRDLSPNVCALWVESEFRGRGIARRLLGAAEQELREAGFSALYLLTNHTGFYERYGWEFLCPVTGEGEEEPSRMYRKALGNGEGAE